MVTSYVRRGLGGLTVGEGGEKEIRCDTNP